MPHKLEERVTATSLTMGKRLTGLFCVVCTPKSGTKMS